MGRSSSRSSFALKRIRNWCSLPGTRTGVGNRPEGRYDRPASKRRAQVSRSDPPPGGNVDVSANAEANVDGPRFGEGVAPLAGPPIRAQADVSAPASAHMDGPSAPRAGVGATSTIPGRHRRSGCSPASRSSGAPAPTADADWSDESPLDTAGHTGGVSCRKRVTRAGTRLARGVPPP